MTKKKFKWNLIKVLVLFLIFVGIPVLFSLLFQDDFNPETDICLECRAGVNQIAGAGDELSCKFIEKNYEYFECIEWRPKNKCELECEDKEILSWSGWCRRNCKCDEATPVSKTLYHINPGPDDKDFIITSINVCSKARFPNECELGNPDWVWDEKQRVECDGEFVGYIENNEINLGEHYDECLQISEKICRKKTIYDYNCEELKLALVLDLNIRICPINYWHGLCWTGVSEYNQDEIYEIFKEKGCEI